MLALRYPIIKERMRMYLNMGKTSNAKTQLDQLEDVSKKADSDSLKTDLLYTQAAYFYTLRQNDKGDATIRQLIEESNRQQAAEAQGKYDTLKQQYDMSLQTIEEKIARSLRNSTSLSALAFCPSFWQQLWLVWLSSCCAFLC